MSGYIDFDQVKLDVVGRWQGIYESLGINVGDGRHTYCPICKTSKKHFRCDDKTGNGEWICTCSAGDGWKLLQEVLGCNFKEAIEQVAPLVGTINKSKICKEKKVDPKILRDLFTKSNPIKNDDLAWQYLRGRGIKTIPPTLRYTTQCYEPELKKDIPAMLAVVSLPNSEAVTMHRTFLDPITANKAKIEKPKKLMPGLKKITGGAIRLFEPDNGCIGLAEGIETALACVDRFKIPVWATISSTMMESFEPPKGISKIIIFGDNDKNYAGQKAAYTLAHKMVLKKLNVEVVVPDLVGDWLDHINEI